MQREPENPSPIVPVSSERATSVGKKHPKRKLTYRTRGAFYGRDPKTPVGIGEEAASLGRGQKRKKIWELK